MLKQTLSIALLLLCFARLQAQTYTLSVTNGYGSGSYHAGDTVHIWSAEYDSTKTFSTWTGDVQYLEKLREWHTSIIMPNQNVSVSAVIANMPTYTIRYEKIMGGHNLKNVYTAFPLHLKGVIYLLHGTGGNATNWIYTSEYRSFVNAAIADSFGIVVTEAEEITLNNDLNGDGKLRWHTFPIDTVNEIDYLNIKAITDTFIHRGNITAATPLFSVGMSNGGSFSATLSYAYNFQAGVSYCASSAQAVFNVRNIPFAFRMALYDDNAEVGPPGNYAAWQNDSLLAARGICHDYAIHDRQPLYPERFARIQGISTTISQAIFNDLMVNNQLDNRHYALHSDSIKKNLLAHPSWYPSIIPLTTGLQLEVLNQISTSNAEHKFYSDYNSETLSFFNTLCTATDITENASVRTTFSVYPNPANNQLHLTLPEAPYMLSVYNAVRQRLYTFNALNNSYTIDISTLNNGVYFIQAIGQHKTFTSRFIKQ